MSLMFYITAGLGLLLAAGVLFQAIGAAVDNRRFPPPGRLVDIGGRRLHFTIAGYGEPTVVLEAGIAASSLSWSRVFPEVARFAQVCSYDRAGLAWSDTGPNPRDAETSVHELRELLQRAGLPPPYVLVGHSFGGCVVRLFAVRYPGEVAGLVFVDALAPEEWLNPSREQRRMLKGGALFSYIGAFLAAVGVVRFCLWLLKSGATWFPRMFVRSMGEGVSSTAGRIVGEVLKLPPEVLPQIAALWCKPKCYRSMAAHLLALPESSKQVATACALGAIPVIVLSANNLNSARLRDHQQLAQLSASGRHLIATNCGHWIHLDQPELVVHAIREIVEMARKKQEVAN